MSLAKKCDICGKYYEDYSMVFKNEKINAFVFVETDEECRYNCSKDATDCCPECLSSITHHIRMLETKHSSDFLARQILADLAGGTVNDTTNSLIAKFIFGNDQNPQKEFH